MMAEEKLLFTRRVDGFIDFSTLKGTAGKSKEKRPRAKKASCFNKQSSESVDELDLRTIQGSREF